MSAYIDEEFIGGLANFTAWKWLFIKWLWIRDDARGLDAASRAVEAAEAESRKRGCRAAWLDTLNPHAHELYARHGYRTFGEIADFCAGQTCWFMQKRFDQTFAP